jgi:hypothetical protein
MTLNNDAERVELLLREAGLKVERSDVNEYLALVREVGWENVETAFRAAFAEGKHRYYANVAVKARALANGRLDVDKPTPGDERRAKYVRPENPFIDAVVFNPPLQPEVHEELWRDIQGEVELQLTAGAFMDWVRPLSCQGLKDDTLVVLCPDGRRLEIAELRKPYFLRQMKRLGMDGLSLEFRLAPEKKRPGTTRKR